MSVQVKGVGLTRQAFRAFDRATGRHVEGAVDTTADRIVDGAKMRAPEDRGTLRSDIHKEVPHADPLFRFAGITKEQESAEYAPVQEFGWEAQNIPAQPYLFPAAEAERDDHRRRCADAVRRAIRGVSR